MSAPGLRAGGRRWPRRAARPGLAGPHRRLAPPLARLLVALLAPLATPVPIRLRAALLAALLTAQLAGCREAPAPPPPPAREAPNVLFVLADDLRWDALGAYGNPDVRTPQLDRLAAEGMTLDAFYVASPVCVASRINFHTGRHLNQAGIVRQPPARVGDDTETVARLFGRAGHHTGFIGKAHATRDPLALGFDEAPFYHLAARGDRPGYDRRVWGVRTEGAAAARPVVVEGDPTARTIDAAIDFVERNRAGRWFLWLATTAPHYPYYRHPEHAYEIDALAAPPGHPPEQPLAHRPMWRHYYELVSHLDAELGRLLATLDRLGLRDDTLVIFTSDNGLMLGSHGILTKGVWHEESTRQPWLARWPGAIDAGRRSDALASSVDWLPTVRELLGLGPAAELEGRSLLGLLRGRGDASRRDAVFSIGQRHPQDGGGGWLMARSQGAKLVRFDRDGELRFYDLRLDPFELHGELGPPPHPPAADALRQRLQRFRLRFGTKPGPPPSPSS